MKKGGGKEQHRHKDSNYKQEKVEDYKGKKERCRGNPGLGELKI